MTIKEGQIGVTTGNIFPIIKKFLYSDHEIFLREVVSNAVDATQKLKTLSDVGEFKGELGNLSVKVSIDKDAGTLTISDRGIGMTAEEVDKYINQIALSSANDFLDQYKDNANAIIGHFGLGFYSTFMVSKKVEIVTKSHKENSEAVKWSCEGNPEYIMTKADKNDRGTDIILYIDEENQDFLEKHKIESLLNKYCKFLPIPVVFGKKEEWKDGKMTETEDDNVINEVNPLWKQKPSELKDEDYIKFYRQLYPMTMDEPLFWIHLNVDYPFNLTGILYFPRIKNNVEIQRNKIQLYSNQVFVTDSVEGIVPEFLTLLHGVLDSPDIPLNVSRSYLQSDNNVKKISNHISKKVSDKLEDLFKKERSQFEEKWDNLKVFIQYGMLTENRFYDKATKFSLVKDVDNKYFTLEEYKTLIEANQKDKDDNLVYLYTTDTEDQYTFIKTAKDKGYDVLIMDGQLDAPWIGQIEQKFEKTRFVRVDSDTIEHLIEKEERKEVEMSDSEKENLTEAFKSLFPVINKTEFSISFKNLGKESRPIQITQDEFSRRMKDMSAMQAGMSIYGDLPNMMQAVVNIEHHIIKDFMNQAKEMSKDECLAIASGNEKLRQIVDLSLLANGMLKGEELNNFITRSTELL